MYNDARDRADDAAEWYAVVLKDAPADQGALRRQIAAVKAEAGPAAAIPLLVKHVDVFQNDLEAWQELGELYLQARSCLEVPKKLRRTACHVARGSGA